MSTVALLALTLLATDPAGGDANAPGLAAGNLVTSVAAELAHADSAYGSGRDDEARAAYRQVLSHDPQSVRANHRLGLLLARVDRLDSALVLIARARVLEPRDAGVLVDEARLLSWAGRLSESIADYDALLAVEPGDREARLGRARVLGWAGRYAAADSMYDALLIANANDAAAVTGRARNAVLRGQPRVAEAQYLAAVRIDANNVEALLGLARLRHDQGRQRSAAEVVSHVLSLEPASSAAAQLGREIRAAQRPQADLGFNVSQDSDRNVSWSRTLSTSLALADGLRGFLTAGSLSTSDPTRDAMRGLGEVGVNVAHGKAQLTLAGGGRWLDPAGGPTRYSPTYRTSVSVRASDQLSAGVGFAHSPLDETALLIGSRLELDDLEGSLDVALGQGFALSGGGGSARLSDGNRRASGLVAFAHPLGQVSSVGVLARAMAYERRGVGYFSPDRFALVEARTTLARSHRAWTERLNGGIGAQQIGVRAATQVAWRAAGELQFRWATINRVIVSIGASNSAASSTTGAYRYLGATLALRIGS